MQFVKKCNQRDGNCCPRWLRCLLICAPIVCLALGGYWWSRFERFKHSDTGTLLNLYITPVRDAFGTREFRLMEEYNVVERGFNCTIYNTYMSRETAEEQLVSHAVGHKHLELHIHGQECVSQARWKSYKYAAIGWFISILCPLFLLYIGIQPQPGDDQTTPGVGVASTTGYHRINSNRIELGTVANPLSSAEREEKCFQEGYRAGRLDVAKDLAWKADHALKMWAYRQPASESARAAATVETRNAAMSSL